MDRRTLIVSGLVTLGTAGLANAEPIQLPPAQPRGSAPPPPPAPPAATRDLPPPNPSPTYPTGAEPPPGAVQPAPPPPPGKASTYSEDEIVNGVSDFLGVTAEKAGGAVELIFAKNARPTAYLAGEAGAV